MRYARGWIVLVALLVTSAFANTYFVQMDLVRGAENAKGAVCVANTVYQPGETVVWRAYVFDAVTGGKLTEAAIKSRELKVQVTLDGGQTLDLAYGAHPPGAPASNQEMYWTGAWGIPADAAAGTYNWTLTVTDGAGHKDSFTPIGQGIGLDQLTIAKPQS
jgi:hypothetical protein